jgi:hypothetical protein
LRSFSKFSYSNDRVFTWPLGYPLHPFVDVPTSMKPILGP